MHTHLNPHPWRSCLMAGLTWLGTIALNGCGGSTTAPAAPPKTAAQTVAELVTGTGYPAALAVQVTTRRIDVRVAG
jgi:hypothetical protein